MSETGTYTCRCGKTTDKSVASTNYGDHCSYACLEETIADVIGVKVKIAWCMRL